MGELRLKNYAWALPAIVFSALFFAERLSPLRRRVDDRPGRLKSNALAALAAGATVSALEAPAVEVLFKRQGGLLQRLPLSGRARHVAALVALDYTLYVWHFLTHKVPLLWRFHAFHHEDRDLDVTTAVRFHCMEMALGVPWRMAQVALIGVPRGAYRAWGLALACSVMFHHANLRLPARLDALLSHLVVTPRLHGIHHSQRQEERDSNWSSGLSVWDRLHRTLRVDVPQDAIKIGI